MELKGASILVVEDEPVVCEIMSVWLERAGTHVLTAANGAEALEALAANKVDVIVSDVQMPVMDGITLLRRLKEGGVHRPVVIFITGYSDLSPRDAYDLGAEALLEKPIERDQILGIVRRCLLDHNTLWKAPVDFVPPVVLHETFDSLSGALQEQRLAFGHGGFCIETSQAMQEGPVGFQIEFRKEQKFLRGEGIVRWTAPLERQIGIELLHVDEANREWVIELARQKGRVAFIPRSVRAEQGAAMKSR